ncbi:MAG: hypothetical protein Q9216_004707 [Gyalolechia sp. 2 TL-2023]
MKATLLVTLVGTLVTLAALQPHRMLFPSQSLGKTLTERVGSSHQHGKRQAQQKGEVHIAWTTVDGPDVIVYVDSHGKPYSTATVYPNQHPPTPAPHAPASAGNPPPQELNGPPPAAPPQNPQPAQPAPAQPGKPPANEGSVTTGPGFKSGISYSPYNGDNSCKSTQQVATDFSKISGYQVIRLYGTDCNQVANVLAATKGSNVKLFLGIFDLAQVQKEAETIANAIRGDWSKVNAISVGNEMVNKGTSPGTVIGAIGQARGVLKNHGYTGPVATVDTMVAMVDHPEICKASDFCAVNCHAFFDGNVPAEKSGEFVKGWVDKIGKATGKTVVVTETGWPSQGNQNGKAIPSPQNHRAAISSIGGALSNNVIYYSAYNDMWKKDGPSTFGAERFWGILGNAPGS